jgi:23S rRNA pseudouridine1911/1915/1917 synthase
MESISIMKSSNDGLAFGKIAFKNEKYLVFDKSSGIAVQSAEKSQVDVCGFLSQHMKTEVFPLTRIDQPVSGLVLFALSRNAAAEASKLVQEGLIQKKYLAVVEGKTNENAKLQDLLIKKGNKAFVSNSGKEAVLEYNLIKIFDHYSLLEIFTQTGRFHQIRAQLSHHGHPIKGDVKYGARRNNKYTGICLHCAAISFTDKHRGENIDLESPWPDSENWVPFK